MSRIVKEWIGQRVVISNSLGKEVGVLLEHGSCWVVWRLSDSTGAEHDEYQRIGARDTIRLATPADKPSWQQWLEDIKRRREADAAVEAFVPAWKRAEFDPFSKP